MIGITREYWEMQKTEDVSYKLIDYITVNILFSLLTVFDFIRYKVKYKKAPERHPIHQYQALSGMNLVLWLHAVQTYETFIFYIYETNLWLVSRYDFATALVNEQQSTVAALLLKRLI